MLMKRGDMNNALAVLAKTADRKAPMPIWSCVKIEVDRTGAHLSAATPDYYVETTIEATGSPLSIAVPARELLDAVKGPKATAGEIIELASEGSALSVRAGGVETRIIGYPAADFPAARVAPNVKPAVVSGLLAALDYCIPAMISADQTRAWINAVHIDPEGVMVTTDGHRMHVAPLSGVPATPVLVSRPMSLALHCAAKRSGDVGAVIWHDDEATVVEVGTWRLSEKRYDFDFPPWRQVIPKRRPGTCAEIAVEAKRFDVLLAKMAPGARNYMGGGVALAIASDELEVSRSAQGADTAEATAKIAAEVIDADKGARIGVSVALLRQALGKLRDRVVLSIDSALDPIIVRAPGGCMAVVMPMRI